MKESFYRTIAVIMIMFIGVVGSPMVFATAEPSTTQVAPEPPPAVVADTPPADKGTPVQPAPVAPPAQPAPEAPKPLAPAPVVPIAPAPSASKTQEPVTTTANPSNEVKVPAPDSSVSTPAPTSELPAGLPVGEPAPQGSPAPVTTTPSTPTSSAEVGSGGSGPAISAGETPTSSAIPALQGEPVVVKAPEPLVVAEQSVAAARNAAATEVTPQEPTSSELNKVNDAVNLAVQARRGDHDNSSSSTTSTTRGNNGGGSHHDDDDHWNGNVRPWEWLEYDQQRRPTLYNPLPNPCDIVYWDGLVRRIVHLLAGQRLVINVVTGGYFPFTAVQIGFGGVAINVLAGGFNGYPPGNPPPPPPPVIQNVTVYYTQINVYKRTTVQYITDCGRDRSHRNLSRVIYNGTSVGWGEWRDDNGRRVFDAAEYQELPGVSEVGNGVPVGITTAAATTSATQNPAPAGFSTGTGIAIGSGVLALVLIALFGPRLWRLAKSDR